MGLSSKEQVFDQIKKSETILVCVGKNPNGDALGSALGFCSALKKMGKKVDIVSPTAILEKYSFLPASNIITHKLEGARDYILSVDVEKDKLQQLRYEVQNNKLKIFITASAGDMKESDIALESSKFRYDLIVIFDLQDLENLGNIYDENSELFYETPVINIDHNPSNEYFGKINLVDVSSSSTAEMVFNLISELGENLLDDQIATDLLTGIIYKTDSFQNKNTTPKAFLAAASLVAKGANKQDIVRYLYKTKSISTLKLMGKIMSNLKYNSQYKLGWSIMEKDEFAKINASQESLSSVAKELANSSPEFNLMFLLYKNDGVINGIINFAENLPAENLAKSLSGKMEHKQIMFASQEPDLESAEKAVLTKIKTWIDNKN
ncbi:MAG: DHH family phosphoesterase [Patescibacteria group bacterium]|nr:DHH family phosphoesterase [Patescibacteria group bacterium]